MCGRGIAIVIVNILGESLQGRIVYIIYSSKLHALTIYKSETYFTPYCTTKYELPRQVFNTFYGRIVSLSQSKATNSSLNYPNDQIKNIYLQYYSIKIITIYNDTTLAIQSTPTLTLNNHTVSACASVML